jgi:hypothetical protein
MFCPACGVELTEPIAVLRGRENTRATFDCECGYTYVVNSAEFTIEIIDRRVEMAEAHNLACHLALMFGPDFRTPAALDRVRSKESA